MVAGYRVAIDFAPCWPCAHLSAVSCSATILGTDRAAILLPQPLKRSASVVAALVRQVQHLPRELRRSLTWDRGKELADHKRLTLATDLEVYFCDPHSPWQRGTNGNTNRLLRQYFPKGTRPVRAQPSQAERRGARTQRATKKDVAVSLTSGDVRRVCCGHRLNRQPKADVQAAGVTPFVRLALKRTPAMCRCRCGS